MEKENYTYHDCSVNEQQFGGYFLTVPVQSSLTDNVWIRAHSLSLYKMQKGDCTSKIFIRVKHAGNNTFRNRKCTQCSRVSTVEEK